MNAVASGSTASVERPQGSVNVADGQVHIKDLYITRYEIAEYLLALPQEERILGLVHAIEVGVLCLERARTAHDIQFVRRQIDGLLHHVEQAAAAIPTAVQRELLGKVGTDEGQVLAPVRGLIDDVRRTLSERLQEVRTLLVDEIDPRSDSSKLGCALKGLAALLDPDRRDSVQGVLADSVAKVVGEDGAVAKTVKSVVGDAVRPLADEVNRLAKQIQANQAVKEALEQTTAKGITYEEEVVKALQEWARGTGVEVHHVGGDNQPGDIVLVSRASSLAGLELSIVVETRDRADGAGRRRTAADLAKAMAHRKAHAGLYVSKTRAGLAAEIGEWAEGSCEQGTYVVTTHDHLVTAVRYMLVGERLAAERLSLPTPDVEAIERQLRRIHTALGRVTEINRSVTAASSALEGIRSEGDALRTDIRGALAGIEDGLRVAPSGTAIESADGSDVS